MAAKKDQSHWERIVESGQRYVDQDDRQSINDWLEGWGAIFCGAVLIVFIATIAYSAVF